MSAPLLERLCNATIPPCGNVARWHAVANGDPYEVCHGCRRRHEIDGDRDASGALIRWEQFDVRPDARAALHAAGGGA